jgi:hypothetical protein
MGYRPIRRTQLDHRVAHSRQAAILYIGKIQAFITQYATSNTLALFMQQVLLWRGLN